MTQNKIHNLKSLLEEKERLKIAVKVKEQQLINHKEFLQSNYKSIIWEKINPFKGESSLGLILSSVLPAVIGVAAPSPISKLLEKGLSLAIEKGSDFLRKKFEKRKEKKKAKEKETE